MKSYLLCLIAVTSVVLFPLVFAQEDFDSGLVAFYSFNGNVLDESGNGNNGNIMNGALFVNDRRNKPNHAIRFDKSLSQYVNVPNSTSLQIENTISFSFWIKRNSLGGQDQVLNKGGDWPNGNCNYGLVFSEWTLCFIYNGGYYIVNSPGVPQDNDWHHYAVTAINGTTEVHFYVDGVEKASMFGGGNPVINLYSQSTSDLHISGINYFSDNSMDELKIYNRILTVNEIISLYLNLAAYYPFNGNTNDESGNMNDGVNHNALFAMDRYGIDNSSLFLVTGVESYVEGMNPGNNLPVGNSPRTFSAWINTGVYNQYGSNIFHYGTQQSAPTNFHFLVTDVLGLGNGYGFGVVYGNQNIVDGIWHFVAGVYEGGTERIVKLYVDGKLDASGTLSTEPNTILGTNWRMGRFMEGSPNFQGFLDEVKVYDVALTEQQIWDLYQSTTTAPNLIAPVNNSTINTLTPVLEWDSLITAFDYRLEIARDSLFTNSLLYQVVPQKTFQVPAGILFSDSMYYWRVRTATNGGVGPWSEAFSFNIVITEVEDEQQFPTKFALMQNYPNPFNPSTVISYRLPVSGNVTLKVYDLLGREVTTLVNEEKPSGSYEIEFNVAQVSRPELSSGIYFYKLQAGSFVKTKKMLLLK